MVQFIDSKMQHSSIDLEAITHVINVAVACVHYTARRRPKMHNVVPMLLEKKIISDF